MRKGVATGEKGVATGEKGVATGEKGVATDFLSTLTIPFFGPTYLLGVFPCR